MPASKSCCRRSVGFARRATMACMSVNADPQELSKFSELAHRWWDEHGEFKPLHAINPLRLD